MTKSARKTFLPLIRRRRRRFGAAGRLSMRSRARRDARPGAPVPDGGGASGVIRTKYVSDG
ncbi:MAG TPA: hypothetical protein VLV15_06010 [Dongiaceae bacterium]|nr:hypothetical protein [Dongiaceae bacterium]